MGIYSKWSFLEHVETTLEQQITHNPLYPFKREEDNPNVMVYKDRPPEFYISCAVSVACVLIISIWVSVVLASSMELSQGLVFPAALLVYFLYRGTQTISERTYKVNIDGGWYKYYVGEQMIHEGKLHHFYFRLREKSSTGFPYYEIVLNGYKVSCVSISGFSKNIRKMRELAKGMSRRLIINYFDYKDISPHHLVHWEKPADITASTPSLLEQEVPEIKDNVMPQLVVPSLSQKNSTPSPPAEISPPRSPPATSPAISPPADSPPRAPSPIRSPSPVEMAKSSSSNTEKSSKMFLTKRQSSQVVPTVTSQQDDVVIGSLEETEI